MAPLDSPPDVRTVLVPAAADIHARTASLAVPAGSVPCKIQGACLILVHAVTVRSSELWSGDIWCIFWAYSHLVTSVAASSVILQL